MPAIRLPPEACQSMAQVRIGVDMLDGEIMRLLAERFAYMRAAARIKPERDDVRDEGRKAEVLANAARLAGERGIPVELVVNLWDRLVEGSIAYELAAWDAGRSAAMGVESDI